MCAHWAKELPVLCGVSEPCRIPRTKVTYVVWDWVTRVPFPSRDPGTWVPWHPSTFRFLVPGEAWESHLVFVSKSQSIQCP